MGKPDAGNLRVLLISDGQLIYHYDSLDRLIMITQEERIIRFEYDPFHRRLSKSEEDKALSHIIHIPPLQTQLYLWDGNHEIGMCYAFSTTFEELRILGAGVGAESGAACFMELHGRSYLPIHDYRGALALLLDLKKGVVVESYRYSAFGIELTGQTLSPWGFSEKRVDRESGLLYFGRRYYNPTLGRWLTPDPQGFADGPNLYAYVHNCPLTCSDPSGLLTNPLAGTASFGRLLCSLTQMFFGTIEFIGQHLIPIPIVRDIVESIGRVGRGGSLFTPCAHRCNHGRIVEPPGEHIPNRE